MTDASSASEERQKGIRQRTNYADWMTQAQKDRFWLGVDKAGPGGCWLWTRSKNRQGYGRVGLSGKLHGVHRVSWELLRGPIPADLTVDHLCRVRGCVNPDHLEIVTNRENVMRGDGPCAKFARMVTCPRGHSREQFYKTDRQSCCRECARESLRRRREAGIAVKSEFCRRGHPKAQYQNKWGNCRECQRLDFRERHG